MRPRQSRLHITLTGQADRSVGADVAQGGVQIEQFVGAPDQAFVRAARQSRLKAPTSKTSAPRSPGNWPTSEPASRHETWRTTVP
ncbi:hypothetical protein Pden_0205 [Paracoccus denitrificans PD1222]|uniref:Uncharacterized protein n=1 Tax=Paracoccus denitrificans (strain Pd 1222) TaxID=318586 RepID=A1AYH5_PARDP|nr:hypothetical protein Pden_0205 [Paracoccus denitrificans PD1222]